MDRTQAVSIIKEISEQCPYLEGKSIKLLTPKENDAVPNAFQLHIQALDDPILVSCIETVAEKHNLATKQIEGYLVMYNLYPKLALTEHAKTGTFIKLN
jgi:hypothetical protein